MNVSEDGRILSKVIHERVDSVVQTVTAILMSIALCTVPTLGQGTKITAYNINNIVILDGIHYAQNAAGINQADADLGSNPGEVWVPSGTIAATDAQISIRAGHVLRVFGVLQIDAIGKGAILLGNYATLTCSGTGGVGNGTIVQGSTPNTPMLAMVQGAVQNGNQESFAVEHCAFNANGQPVSRGVIDITGMNDKGRVQDNIVYNFSSGWALYLDDQFPPAPPANNSESSNSRVEGNWFNPGGGSNGVSTGGCIFFSHQNVSNGIQFDNFQFYDNECNTSGHIAKAAVQFTNIPPSAAGLIRSINISGMRFLGGVNAFPSIDVNGVQVFNAYGIMCDGVNSDCIKIENNANNSRIDLNEITNPNGGATVNDVQHSFASTNAKVTWHGYETATQINNFSRLISGSTNAAAAGAISLSNTDQIKWRNAANNNDDVLGVNSSDFPFFQPSAGTPRYAFGLSRNTGTAIYASTRNVPGCNTAASVGGLCPVPAVKVSWPPNAFADSNYSVTCTPSGPPTNLPGPPFVVSKAADSVTINYFAMTAAVASWASIDCEAIHD